MRHEIQSEDASLEENSKRLKWQNFSVPDTAAKRGLSFKGRYFSTIDRGGCLSDGEIRRSWGVCFRSIADLHQRLKTPKEGRSRCLPNQYIEVLITELPLLARLS